MTMMTDQRIRDSYKEDEKENTISSLKVENAELRIALSKLLDSYVKLLESGDVGDVDIAAYDEITTAKRVLGPKDFRSSMRGMKL